MAATRDEAHSAFDRAQARFSAKYPKRPWSVWLKIDKEMLTFYDFPAEHWMYIRTTKPIASTCATASPFTHETDSQLWLSRHHIGDGLQAS